MEINQKSSALTKANHSEKEIYALKRRALSLLMSSILVMSVNSQSAQLPLLNIGDSAPPLRVDQWLKGSPVQTFEEGHVYVLEFWATWCVPCLAAMPHLSDLARKYKDNVTFIGIDVYEGKTKTEKSNEKLKAFVDSVGRAMDFSIATEDTNHTVLDWLVATGEQGIPATFVVNADGRLAWIGYPKNLNEVLSKIMDGTWNLNNALAKRKEEIRIAELDKAANDTLYEYMSTVSKQDSALFIINQIVTDEPKLKYAPFMAFNTFLSLLRTDQHKACEYGNAVLLSSTFTKPSYDAIIRSIQVYAENSKLLPEVYGIGAEAYRLLLNDIPYPEIVDTYRYYNKMANWYSRAGNKSKAVTAMQKAIDILKSKKNFSQKDMSAFIVQLNQYKKM